MPVSELKFWCPSCYDQKQCETSSTYNISLPEKQRENRTKRLRILQKMRKDYLCKNRKQSTQDFSTDMRMKVVKCFRSIDCGSNILPTRVEPDEFFNSSYYNFYDGKEVMNLDEFVRESWYEAGHWICESCYIAALKQEQNKDSLRGFFQRCAFEETQRKKNQRSASLSFDSASF